MEQENGGSVGSAKPEVREYEQCSRAVVHERNVAVMRWHPHCERSEYPGGVQTQFWRAAEAAEGCGLKSNVNRSAFYEVYSVCGLEKWL